MYHHITYRYPECISKMFSNNIELSSPTVGVTHSSVQVALFSEVTVAQSDRLHSTYTGSSHSLRAIVASIIESHVISPIVTTGYLCSRIVERVVGVLAKTETVRGARQAQSWEESDDDSRGLETRSAC